MSRSPKGYHTSKILAGCNSVLTRCDFSLVVEFTPAESITLLPSMRGTSMDSSRDMGTCGEGGSSDVEAEQITTVLTCKGDIKDPKLPLKLSKLIQHLQIITDCRSSNWLVTRVEPWNSVRVTFSIPKEAAGRLHQLAQAGDAALRQLGILSVQVQGDQIISLRVAGPNNEPAEIILRTTEPVAGPSGEQSGFSNPARPPLATGLANMVPMYTQRVANTTPLFRSPVAVEAQSGPSRVQVQPVQRPMVQVHPVQRPIGQQSFIYNNMATSQLSVQKQVVQNVNQNQMSAVVHKHAVPNNPPPPYPNQERSTTAAQNSTVQPQVSVAQYLVTTQSPSIISQPTRIIQVTQTNTVAPQQQVVNSGQQASNQLNSISVNRSLQRPQTNMIKNSPLLVGLLQQPETTMPSVARKLSVSSSTQSSLENGFITHPGSSNLKVSDPANLNFSESTSNLNSTALTPNLNLTSSITTSASREILSNSNISSNPINVSKEGLSVYQQIYSGGSVITNSLPVSNSVNQPNISQQQINVSNSVSHQPLNVSQQQIINLSNSVSRQPHSFSQQQINVSVSVSQQPGSVSQQLINASNSVSHQLHSVFQQHANKVSTPSNSKIGNDVIFKPQSSSNNIYDSYSANISTDKQKILEQREEVSNTAAPSVKKERQYLINPNTGLLEPRPVTDSSDSETEHANSNVDLKPSSLDKFNALLLNKESQDQIVCNNSKIELDDSANEGVKAVETRKENSDSICQSPGEKIKLRLKLGKEEVAQATIIGNPKIVEKKDCSIIESENATPEPRIPKLHIKLHSSQPVIVKSEIKDHKVKRKTSKTKSKSSDLELEFFKAKNLKLSTENLNSEDKRQGSNLDNQKKHEEKVVNFSDSKNSKLTKPEINQLGARLKTTGRRVGDLSSIGEITSHKIMENLPPSITKVAAIHTQNKNPTFMNSYNLPSNLFGNSSVSASTFSSNSVSATSFRSSSGTTSSFGSSSAPASSFGNSSVSATFGSSSASASCFGSNSVSASSFPSSSVSASSFKSSSVSACFTSSNCASETASNSALVSASPGSRLKVESERKGNEMISKSEIKIEDKTPKDVLMTKVRVADQHNVKGLVNGDLSHVEKVSINQMRYKRTCDEVVAKQTIKRKNVDDAYPLKVLKKEGLGAVPTFLNSSVLINKVSSDANISTDISEKFPKRVDGVKGPIRAELGTLKSSSDITIHSVSKSDISVGLAKVSEVDCGRNVCDYGSKSKPELTTKVGRVTCVDVMDRKALEEALKSSRNSKKNDCAGVTISRSTTAMVDRLRRWNSIDSNSSSTVPFSTSTFAQLSSDHSTNRGSSVSLISGSKDLRELGPLPSSLIGVHKSGSVPTVVRDPVPSVGIHKTGLGSSGLNALSGVPVLQLNSEANVNNIACDISNCSKSSIDAVKCSKSSIDAVCSKSSIDAVSCSKSSIDTTNCSKSSVDAINLKNEVSSSVTVEKKLCDKQFRETKLMENLTSTGGNPNEENHGSISKESDKVNFDSEMSDSKNKSRDIAKNPLELSHATAIKSAEIESPEGTPKGEHGNGHGGEDSGIESMDALSEKSPNHSDQSPIRRDEKECDIFQQENNKSKPPRACVQKTKDFNDNAPKNEVKDGKSCNEFENNRQRSSKNDIQYSESLMTQNLSETKCRLSDIDFKETAVSSSKLDLQSSPSHLNQSLFYSTSEQETFVPEKSLNDVLIAKSQTYDCYKSSNIDATRSDTSSAIVTTGTFSAVSTTTSNFSTIAATSATFLTTATKTFSNSNVKTTCVSTSQSWPHFSESSELTKSDKSLMQSSTEPPQSRDTLNQSHVELLDSNETFEDRAEMPQSNQSLIVAQSSTELPKNNISITQSAMKVAHSNKLSQNCIELSHSNRSQADAHISTSSISVTTSSLSISTPRSVVMTTPSVSVHSTHSLNTDRVFVKDMHESIISSDVKPSLLAISLDKNAKFTNSISTNVSTEKVNISCRDKSNLAANSVSVNCTNQTSCLGLVSNRANAQDSFVKSNDYSYSTKASKVVPHSNNFSASSAPATMIIFAGATQTSTTSINSHANTKVVTLKSGLTNNSAPVLNPPVGKTFRLVAVPGLNAASSNPVKGQIVTLKPIISSTTTKTSPVPKILSKVKLEEQNSIDGNDFYSSLSDEAVQDPDFVGFSRTTQCTIKSENQNGDLNSSFDEFTPLRVQPPLYTYGGNRDRKKESESEGESVHSGHGKDENKDKNAKMENICKDLNSNPPVLIQPNKYDEELLKDSSLDALTIEIPSEASSEEKKPVRTTRHSARLSSPVVNSPTDLEISLHMDKKSNTNSFTNSTAMGRPSPVPNLILSSVSPALRPKRRRHESEGSNASSLSEDLSAVGSESRAPGVGNDPAAKSVHRRKTLDRVSTSSSENLTKEDFKSKNWKKREEKDLNSDCESLDGELRKKTDLNDNSSENNVDSRPSSRSGRSAVQTRRREKVQVETLPPRAITPTRRTPRQKVGRGSPAPQISDKDRGSTPVYRTKSGRFSPAPQIETKLNQATTEKNLHPRHKVNRSSPAPQNNNQTSSQVEKSTNSSTTPIDKITQSTPVAKDSKKAVMKLKGEKVKKGMALQINKNQLQSSGRRKTRSTANNNTSPPAEKVKKRRLTKEKS